jgi:hypothetical protein
MQPKHPREPIGAESRMLARTAIVQDCDLLTDMLRVLTPAEQAAIVPLLRKLLLSFERPDRST